jgi:EPSP synthase (3-phosphoshikimate 1-carboxyvinyltransferase)
MRSAVAGGRVTTTCWSSAVVTELRRMGINAEEEPDGFIDDRGTPRPADVETYDDTAWP